MSDHQDRIAQWRARREAQASEREANASARAAHADLPGDLALVAGRAEALAAETADDAGAMLDLVLEAPRAQPSETIAERRAIYDAVARGIERGIERVDSHSEFAELRRRQLRAIIRLIEGEARSGIDVREDDYRPAGFDEATEPLVVGYRRRRQRADEEETRKARRQAVLADEAYTIAVPADEEADLHYLRGMIALIDATGGAGQHRRGHPFLRAFMALLRYQFVLLRSESRLALAWTLLGPAVLLALISTGYYLTGYHTVLNMDVPTFAMLGATTWIMFRNVIFRSSTSFYAHRWMLNLRPYSPAMIGATQGAIYICAYSVVYVVLIGLGSIAGLFTLPHNLPVVVMWIASMGLSGMAIGMIFGTLAVLWPYFLRFAPAIERSLQIFSAVFFVSEQLPADYRPYMLWSPFAHALQLLRSAYFEGYTSEDADPEYFFICFGLLVLVAIVAQRSVRSRSIPS